MATYNGERFIKRQLDSILIQLGLNDEVIIVDDCSSDGTVEIIRQIGDPRIKLFVNEENLREVKTFEKAIELAGGRYIFLSDQDDIWTPGRYRLMQAALKEKEALCVSGNFDTIDPDGNHVDYPVEKLRAQDSTEYNKNILRIFAGKGFYYGCAMAFDSRLKETILPFPKGLECHDLWIAMAANYLKSNVHLEESVLLHTIHGSNVTDTKRPLKDKLKSRAVMLSMYWELKKRTYKEDDAEDPEKPGNSKLFHDVSTTIAKLINVVFMAAPFVFVWYMFYADQLWVKFVRRGHWLVILFYILMYLVIGKVYDAFRISYNSKGEMIYSQALSLLEVNIFMYIVEWLLIRHAPRVLPMIGVYVVQMALAALWSHVAQNWYFKTFPANKTVIIWDVRQGISNLIEKYDLKKKFRVVGDMSVEQCLANLSILDNVDTVFIVGVHSHERNIIAKYCLMHDIKAFLIPKIGDLIVTGAKRTQMFHLLMLKVERFNPSLWYLLLKRLGDIVLSLIAIVIFSPIMIATAICIKREDNGPVIYKQVRLTKDGKQFKILKFRSMRIDAEKDGVARLSTGDHDDRITKVGRFIRKVRIDELPQLFNILKGDLSIVGPRAERPELAAEYEKQLPEFALRLQAKAGLTGYAQVYGKYNTTPYDKLLMDLMYIANASVFEDISIIFATVKILFMPESTEGIEEGKTSAM